MTSLSEVLADPGVRQRHPVLCRAVRRMGSVQIRNSATLVGNLVNASPCADSAPPLMVLGARVEIDGPTNGPRQVSLDDFFVGPGTTCLDDSEVVTAVVVPAQGSARATYFRKDRVYMDLALTNLALLLELDGGRICRARIAAGAVAPVPIRLRKVEELLEGGGPIDEALIHQAREMATQTVAPISDIRASEEYRRHIVGVFVARGIEELMRDI